MARIGNYVWNIILAIDTLGNSCLAGNRKQTISSRLYEAAVLHQLIAWKPLYYGVNGVAYALRWLFGRALGFRFGVDMPRNHCLDAFLSNPERTYVDR